MDTVQAARSFRLEQARLFPLHEGPILGVTAAGDGGGTLGPPA